MSDEKCPTCGGDEFDARPGNPKRCCNCGWTSDKTCPDCGTRMGNRHRRSEYAKDGGLEFPHTEARCMARQIATKEAENNQLYHACEGLKEQLADMTRERDEARAACVAYRQHIVDHVTLPDDECQGGWYECQFCGGVLDVVRRSKRSLITGHADDCPVIAPNPGQPILDRLAAAEAVVDAAAALLPPMDDVAGVGWWCPTCQDWIAGEHVTYAEAHATCGTYLGDCQPEDKWEPLRAALAAREAAGKERQ